MNDITARRFLVVIETQKVKSYLFASPIMRETRGGSVLLDALNRKETKRILQELGHVRYEEIYLGGGSGRVLFENKHDAEKFKKEVLELYRRETTNARVSVEIVERINDESFAEWVSRGVMMTQQNKLGRVEGVPVLAGRWIRPCTSCGSEPAEMTLSEHREHWLCRACSLKRENVNGLYKEIKPTKRGSKVLKSSSALALKYTDNFIFSTLAKYNEEANCQVFLPQDFDDIGQFSRPSNYMGFIYADGNRMGETIKEIGRLFPKDEDAKRAYKAFSEIVDQATREAAVEVILKVVDFEEWKTADGMYRSIPAEFIMAGGDDLMLAVPSHNAMDVAVLFIERFQEKTKQLQEDYVKNGKLPKPFAEKGLTTSAGVVIAHTNYPISDLMSLAGELMKIAKKKSAELLHTQGCETGTLDFLALTEAGSVFLFKAKGGREPLIPDENGMGWIGDNNGEGFGHAVLWHTFHIKQEKEAVL
ncbi:MAG: hypothetical protein HW390_1438 [Candidatus Brocadiaceae bacterium]|nr:hypothetical protein [Candidatus Brocadiaceae bacterium]